MDYRGLVPVVSSPQPLAEEGVLGTPPKLVVAPGEPVASDALALLLADPMLARLFGAGCC